MSKHQHMAYADKWWLPLSFVLTAVVSGCTQDSNDPPEVVVYSSVDDVFARPIAARFQDETGIRVLLVPDTEETKSTGLLNRLIAERARPQADVFWSGDPVRASILSSRGISEPYQSPAGNDIPLQYRDGAGHWTGFSARARVLIYNTNLVPEAYAPTSIMDLLDSQFAGQSCIANPLFGTTSMHAAALFQTLGQEGARRFFEQFIENGGTILSSNGEVRRRVAAGDFAIGITDTDDYNVAFLEGQPVRAVYPDQDGIGTLIIPNAAVLIAGAPNPDQGRQFIDFLLRPQIEQALAESEAAQIPLRPAVGAPAHVIRLEQLHSMSVNYATLADELEVLRTGFLAEWVARHSE